MKFKIYNTFEESFQSDNTFSSLEEAVPLMRDLLLSEAGSEEEQEEILSLKSLSDFFNFAGIAPRIVS